MENGQPSYKIMWALTCQISRASFHIRNTVFGKTSIAPAYTEQGSTTTQFVNENFYPRILTDVSISYVFKKWVAITAGANNILNVYPTQLRDARNADFGRYIYSMEASPFGFNGGYYFVSAEINF